jgi:hypothetical protein
MAYVQQPMRVPKEMVSSWEDGGKVIAHICWKQFHNDACASAARVTVEYMHTN